VDVFVCALEEFVCCAAISTVDAAIGARCSGFFASEDIDTGKGVVDLAPRPWPGLFVLGFVVATIDFELVENEVIIEVEKGFESGDHPCEGDVGEFHVCVATTHVRMDARKPDLFEVLDGGGLEFDIAVPKVRYVRSAEHNSAVQKIAMCMMAAQGSGVNEIAVGGLTVQQGAACEIAVGESAINEHALVEIVSLDVAAIKFRVFEGSMELMKRLVFDWVQDVC
jgi:hypothetical protein